MSTTKAFLGVNLDLLENPKYKSLDSRATMLYALYADRYAASLHNARLGNTAFVDNMGVFIRFTNDLAAKALRVSQQKITDFRKQLSDCGLIKVVRDGLKGYKIYVAPVEETPSNVELILPWKNHHIETIKVTSSWTTLSKLEFCKSLHLSAQTTDMTVHSKSRSTCHEKSDTSLSQSSLSQSIVNYNGLVGNAHAREASQTENQTKSQQVKKPNPYHTLPDTIKKSFNNTFGFITAPVAIELHTLIDQANEEMVNYAITSSKGRKITSPISYLKAAIANAVKRGAKCAQDMVEYYNDHVKGNATKRGARCLKPRYMSHEQAKEKVDAAMQQLRLNSPEEWLRITQEQKAQFCPKIVTPIFHLGE